MTADAPADPADARSVIDVAKRLVAAEAERDRLADQLAAVPALWSWPDCAFTFDAMHTDGDGGWSCPACGETRLAAQLAAVREACWPLANYLENELGISDEGDHAGITWLENTHLGELSEAAYLALLAASPSTPEETRRA